MRKCLVVLNLILINAISFGSEQTPKSLGFYGVDVGRIQNVLTYVSDHPASSIQELVEDYQTLAIRFADQSVSKERSFVAELGKHHLSMIHKLVNSSTENIFRLRGASGKADRREVVEYYLYLLRINLNELESFLSVKDSDKVESESKLRRVLTTLNFIKTQIYFPTVDSTSYRFEQLFKRLSGKLEINEIFRSLQEGGNPQELRYRLSLLVTVLLTAETQVDSKMGRILFRSLIRDLEAELSRAQNFKRLVAKIVAVTKALNRGVSSGIKSGDEFDFLIKARKEIQAINCISKLLPY